MSQQPLLQNDLPSLSIRRPVLIVVLNLLIIIAGLAAFNAIEVRELPDVDRPIVSVTAAFPGDLLKLLIPRLQVNLKER